MPDNIASAGGKLPIDSAVVSMKGSLPAGSTCTSLAAPDFGLKTKIQVKWTATVAGKAKTVRRTPTGPSGVTRSNTGSGTANERVGQS